MKKLSPVLATVIVLTMNGCAQQVNVVAERAAVREAERETMRAANNKESLDGWVALFAEDATLFPANAPALRGKEAIGEWAKGLEMPRPILKFQNDKTEVSRAGDVGYALGRYELTMNDSEENPVTEPGTYVTIYRKQRDGTWKIAAHIWNTDQPPLAAPSS